MTFARFRRSEDVDVSSISSISSISSFPRESHETDRSSLLEEARALAPCVRLTVRATADEAADRVFIAEVWSLLRNHPGDNLVRVRLIDDDGTVWRVRDRALATPELRKALARLLVRRSIRPSEADAWEALPW